MRHYRAGQWVVIVVILAFAGAGLLRSAELAGRAQPPDAQRYAIIISIDGLMPASYTEADAHGLKIPAMRELMAAGAWSPGVRDVLPAVTYPAHTTMATGVSPARHGIVSNTVFDPLGQRDGEWYWYEPELRAPTLWQLARARGLRTSLIAWPVTMGAAGDAVMPEFWRGRGIDGAQLMRAISTPGLFAQVERRFPGFDAGFSATPPKDPAFADIAVDVVERLRPNLLMLHMSEVDHWEHEHGPWSAEALAAIELADAQIGRVMAAARHAGIWENTLFLVVSDHGFSRQEKVVRPGVLLRERGLVTVDEKNHVASWRAQVLSSGGSAYVYLHDPNDRETAKTVLEIFEPLVQKHGSGIRRLISHEAIAAMGGDPLAFVAIEADDGFGFAGGVAGEAIGLPTEPGLHGFPPDRDMMNASLILDGPGVRPGKIEGARQIDIAPTVAQWLGIRMENVEGKPLDVFRAPSATVRPR